MTELFNMPETLSPRLAWMKQHNLSVESGTNLDDGDRFFEVRQGNKVILEDPSEDRAIVRAAKKLNLNLWNEATGEKRTRFVFCFIETESPYESAWVELSENLLDIGRAGYMNAVAKWQTCVATNHWPKRIEGILKIETPKYIAQMKQTIDISIDISKIDKTALYTSPKTKKQYLSMTLLLREEKDQYGNDGFIVQKISKERKAAGERGAILGNGKIMDWDAPNPKMHGGEKSNGYSSQITGNDDDQEIPF